MPRLRRLQGSSLWSQGGQRSSGDRDLGLHSDHPSLMSVQSCRGCGQVGLHVRNQGAQSAKFHAPSSVFCVAMAHCSSTVSLPRSSVATLLKRVTIYVSAWDRSALPFARNTCIAFEAAIVSASCRNSALGTRIASLEWATAKKGVPPSGVAVGTVATPILDSKGEVPTYP